VPASHVLDIQYATRSRRVPRRRQIESWVAAGLQRRRGAAEVTVRMVDRREGSELNQRWRRRAGPTNVLSFPATGVEDIAPDFLGDIVICAPVVNEEARRQGKQPDAHWAHMIIHGTLHLLGFDHDTDAAAQAMEKLETEILGRLDYPDPYLPRA